MDYKEQIYALEKYFEGGELKRGDALRISYSIKTLLAERDAAIKDLEKVCDDNPDVCQYCKHMPCTDNNGKCIGWEWRGVDGK